MINVFWHKSDNFGDAITPYILNKLGIKFQFIEQRASVEHYVMCGSIISSSNENAIIWGSGIAQPEQPLVKPQSIHAVRGVKTREYVLSKGVDCSEAYGDPAQLLPLLFNPKVEKKREVLFMPHMVDYPSYAHLENVLNVCLPTEQVITEILASDRIVSSALHPIIVAQAYGVLWEWQKSDNVIGQEYKFEDFRQTMPLYDLRKFIDSCPIKLPL